MNVPRLFVPPCVKTARRRYVQSPSAGESVNANGVGTGIATPSGAGAARTGSVAGLESRVTAPFWASNRPTTVAPVLSVMEVTAKIEPWRTELTPIVAELPTAQKTFTACAPLIRTTLRGVTTVRAEPTMKTNTAPGLPWPSRIKSPEEISMVDAEE